MIKRTTTPITTPANGSAPPKRTATSRSKTTADKAADTIPEQEDNAKHSHLASMAEPEIIMDIPAEENQQYPKEMVADKRIEEIERAKKDKKKDKKKKKKAKEKKAKEKKAKKDKKKKKEKKAKAKAKKEAKKKRKAKKKNKK